MKAFANPCPRGLSPTNPLPWLVAPELDDLRSEPRFKEMLKRMNLPE